jgi:hypothetical protein
VPDHDAIGVNGINPELLKLRYATGHDYDNK